MASRRVGGTLRAAISGQLLFLVLLLPAVCSGQLVSIGFLVGSEYEEIPEEQPVGTLIIDFQTAYVDSLGSFHGESSGFYYFSEPTAADVDKFSLNANTGQIRNAVTLDRDAPGAQTNFRLAVTFSTTDNSTSATITVDISLVDINDNAPRFTQDVYEALVTENTAPGVAFFNVTALDVDQVQREQVIDEDAEDFGGFRYVVSNGRVVYSIIDGNELGHFAIQPDTGDLMVATGEMLDVDDIDLYNLTILAEDGGGLNDTAVIFIRVLDSNDNPPQIHSPLSVELTISEDTAVGFVVINSINATDADMGPNADIEFLILSGDITGSFSINSTIGELMVSGSLDREAVPGATVSLTIAARDHGIPPLQATIPVTIHLLDINDSPPQFDQTSYTLSVSEAARIGDQVGKVTAIDLDAEENGTVSYSLVNLISSQFLIDPSTGVITTNITLDREDTPFYYLTVEAVDNPNNSSLQLSNTVNVSIAVADVNDNSPIWVPSNYTAGVLDTAVIGHEVIRLQASDKDSGTNGEIRYMFFGATDSDFAIDLTTGSVTVNANLNFATKSAYQYQVRAFDSAAVPRDAFADLNITVHTPNINPPRFEFPSYSATVNEVLSIGSIALNVTATDSDLGLIGEVRYRITAESVFDKAGSFSVDPNTGAVIVSSSLDFDFRDNITFMVEAYDGGFPEPFTDRTNVTVFLLNSNDEAPTIIVPSSETLTVPENESPPIEIGNLFSFASDPDPGNGGNFNLSLVDILGDDFENDSFSFNSSTGIVTALRIFDREYQPEGFTLQVLATDFGTPTQSSINNVTILIGDRNDQSPFFEDNVTATVYEFQPPGQLVFPNYTAVDLDIGTNAELDYAVFAGDTFNSFTVDSTGTLSTTKILNKTEQRFYNLTIMTMDKGIPPLIGFGLIFVEVLDANDHAPIFLGPLEAYFEESDPPGTVFYQLNATDPDEGTNAILAYFFAPNSTDSFSYFNNDTNITVTRFGINSTSGDIFTNAVFDREVEDLYNLTVIAVDMGVVPITSTATIIVHLQDNNDQIPQFTNASYSIQVTENVAVNTSLLTVAAIDNDASSPNNIIQFSLSGNRSDELNIDSDTGEVSVGGEIDWEEGEEFTVIVNASDLGDPPLSSQVNLTVFIENVNDRSPEWIVESLNLSVYENQAVGARVGNIKAIDPDSDNFSYQFAPNFTSKYFALNATTGEVTTLVSFDREERDLYEVLVESVDHDIPQQTSAVEIAYIQILDVNDNSPYFLQPLYTGSISENSTIGTSVLTAQAMDTDILNNSELVYSIPSANYSSLFSINETTGVLYTNSIFDYEDIPVFSFKIQVADEGTPSLTANTTVTVFVIDYNDEAPVFMKSSYAAVTEENIAVGTILLQVQASDPDDGDNAKVTYSIIASPGSDRFGIDPDTGVLYTTKPINREEYHHFNLAVIANNSLSQVVQLSTVSVFINVTDLNDQHPSFEPIREVRVHENIAPGTVAFTLTADDGDEGLNGTVTYQLLQGNDDGFFALNSSTGVVNLVKELDYEDRNLFFLTFNATDQGSEQLSNYTTVILRVVDTNDNMPVFITSQYITSVNYARDVGEVVLVVMATDRDSGINAELTFSIVAGNEMGLFTISPHTGSIAISQSLISHSGIVVNFTVAANDSNSQATTEVLIHIQGSGATPYFTALSFQANITESSPTHMLLDLYPHILPPSTFEIVAGNEEGVFAITSGGELTANGSMIDYEEKSSYQLSVAARSGGGVAYTLVNVQVMDINEHAPVFPVATFYAHFSETARRGQIFFTVLATDQDGSPPANTVHYSITSGNENNKFQINSATGELSLNSLFDYNTDDRNYTLNVTATNPGSPLSTTVTVEVELLDGNRHKPRFSPRTYTVSLQENPSCDNVTNGTVIETVSATDGDTGSNGEILYGLLGDHHFVDFKIDPFTGRITVERCLDFERQTFYTLIAVASDRGSLSLSATAAVLVAIVDENDNIPQWEQIHYSVTIPENITIGTTIINVTATDADQVDISVDDLGNMIYNNRNGYVSYSISNGDPKGQFRINPDTGIVSIAATLSREDTTEYNLTLNATDGGGRYNNSFLHIIIEDINTFTPNFTADIFYADVPEDAMNGTFITKVTAIDNDLLLNAVISYSITAGNYEAAFYINSTTGDVFLNHTIDREERASYSLTVEATDMGLLPLTGSAILQISILDLNEHPPLFTQDEYTVDVFENEPLGFSILQVNTTDEDYGENATAMYSITSGNEDDLFSIHTTTGVISVAGEVDFEEEESYELIVMATDSGPAATRLSTEVNVTITVLDRNDNQPQLTQTSYELFVAEDTSPLSPLLQLNATDEDSGSNEEIRFSLDYSSDPQAVNVFFIDPDTGLLFLNTSTLDRESQDSYNITVTVTDGGTPPLDSNATLMIFIEDNNDNAPIFGAPLFTGSITENQPPGTTILTVNASDADIGLNALVTYSVSQILQNESDCINQCSHSDLCSSVFSSEQEIGQIFFDIKNSSGVITSGQAFDREAISQYVFVILATDSSINETQLSSSACVHVTVLDQNDNPPSFPAPVFTAGIPENAVTGQFVTTVAASDNDEGTNSDITYMVTDGGAHFTIHPTTGEIRTLVVFDREVQDLYNITVLAVDKGSPEMTGTAVVLVTIIDENDSEPVFSQDVYEVEIPETLPVGYSVLQLNASDADTANHSMFSFAIMSSQPADDFTVNVITGLLLVNKSLDREVIPAYLLTVRVMDQSTPSLFSTAKVNITILDANDNPPEFSENAYNVKVDENDVPSESILVVGATDADTGTNADVFYSIIAVSPPGADISINRTTGALFLLSILDAESSISHNITVRADNGPATPFQYNDIIVVLEVLDMNDNAPEFQFSTYMTLLSENAPVDSSVLQLNANDIDVSKNNSLLIYTIVNSTNDTLFEIDSFDGLITLSSLTDRETQDVHTLTVQVTDSGEPPLFDVVEVTIEITDENDNAPIFQQPGYSYSIDENRPPGVSVGQVYATDSDLQEISYFLSNSTLASDFFTINSTSGVIYSAISFDREEEEIHFITVVAVDDPGALGWTAEVIVNVTILDENDNPPQFLNTSYTAYWAENTTVETVLLIMTASDLDIGENSTIIYSILPRTNDSDAFKINQTTGEILLAKDLDRELQNSYQITVMASDLGPSSLNSTVEVFIHLLDVNDNVPVLNQTLYMAALFEDTPVNAYILTAGATDEDINENADIRFSLSETFGGVFYVNAISGVLSLAKTLDYELVQNYSFFVMAMDSGDPQLVSSSQVLIEVIDINDNSPTFDQDVYQVSIPENSVLGTPVFHIPATDLDSTSNGELRYTILSGNLDSRYALGEASGVITVDGYLDRETQPLFTLGVRVVDQGTPQFTATAAINITVSDVNDHAPQFSSKLLSVTIPEDTELNSSIFVLQASDEDLGENSLLTYEITSGNSLGYFSVDNITGTVTTQTLLDFEAAPPSFSLSVLVHDNGDPQQSDTATLQILLTDVNDNPPALSQSRYLLNISQSTEVGTLIAYLFAVDPERRHSGGQIFYSLGNGSTDEIAISEAGVLYVSSSSLTSGDSRAFVEVSDGERAVSVEIELSILSSSYSGPVFNPTTFLFQVSENAPPNSILGTVMTSTIVNSFMFIDPQGTGHMTSSSALGLFMIQTNGSIILIGQLDYEATPNYVLNVQAQVDGGETIFAVVTIAVLDYNDNAPVFTNTEYQLTLSEVTPLGTAVLPITTYDADSPGPNRETQLLISTESTTEYFSLDPSTGVLTVAQPLDREKRAFFQLIVNASNHLATPVLYSTVTVGINVTDFNDNSPQFGEMFYQVDIFESTAKGSNIIRLNATDPDEGTNSELVFSVVHQSQPGAFFISPMNGTLFSNISLLESDVDSFTVSVMVSDRGSPVPRTDTAVVFIAVHENNNFAPLFSQPSGYAVTIPETLPVSSSVLQVSATDPDDNTSTVSFSIAYGNLNSSFTISATTGLITVNKPLSFQMRSFYTMIVVAEDFGMPRRASNVTVNITITDINNHSPQFNASSYNATIIENTPIGTPVTQVFATDIDTVQILYAITLNFAVDGQDNYVINQTSGEIFTAAPIDRETAPTVELLVSAIDTGYPTQRSTSIPVVIQVLDVNDVPPIFNQTHFSADAVRLLPAGHYVTTVNAYDLDLHGEELQFAIVADTSGGKFWIDPFNATITTTQTITENASNYTNLTVYATDGKLNTTVLVTINIVDEGMFCEAGGFCTSVKPILLTCSYTIPSFPVCNSYCSAGYELSPLRKVCVSHSCQNDSLIPCNSTKECLVPNHICGDQCPDNMGVCPTTNLCYLLSHDQPCDTSPDICVTGQTLVQQVNGTRYCGPSSSLPPPGQACTGTGSVFCEELLLCSNLSAPHLCQLCPAGLLYCPATGECLSLMKECCGSSSYFCSVLDQCIPNGLRCQLPNIAPTIPSDLLLIESLASYYPSSSTASPGHMIGMLLGNNNSLAMDSQGEELGIAITALSNVPPHMGEWQYALCSGPITLCQLCSNLSSPWIPVSLNVSEALAFFLPNTACLRFWRKTLQLEGAVWLQAKVWDGNEDSYLSNATTLVRYKAPFFNTTTPYTNTSSVSEHSMLLTTLLLPVVERPSFNPSASLSLPSIREDTPLVDNLGGAIADIVMSVLVPQLPVHNQSTIPGFPPVPTHIQESSYLELLPSEAKMEYFQQVAKVNPTREKRQYANNAPGVVVSLQGTDNSAGDWQVSPNGDESLFVFLKDLISLPSQVLLLNTSSRLRFLLANNYHGNISIGIRAWDGVVPSSSSETIINGFTASVASIASFSAYSLGTLHLTQLEVESVLDVPIITSSLAQLTPLSYLLQYHYQRLFTVLVAREEASLRADGQHLEDLLYLTLEVPVTIHRLYSANASHTYMSFSVMGNALNQTEIEKSLAAKRSVLSNLDSVLPIISISQEAHYGPGPGCQNNAITRGYPHGDQVSKLLDRFARDDDQDLLGMAVVRVDSQVGQGEWQYLRGNWTTEPEDTGNNAESGLWVNFPPGILETQALLLHGNDRVRFLPKPGYFWSATSVPSITVKAWDTSISSVEQYMKESSRMNINTDPFTDTQQSQYSPVGHFSTGTAVVRATRFGCDGVVNSGMIHDACCVCGGSGAGCAGCDGMTGSNKLFDACDICGGNETSCLGCDFIPSSFSVAGSCGECVSSVNTPTGSGLQKTAFPVTSFQDCAGVCFGVGLVDNCGVCSGGNTSHRYNSDRDCAGRCFGAARIDSCDYCTGPGTDLTFNQFLDCTGVCNGLFRTDSCNVCQLPGEDGTITSHADCFGECFGKAQLDQCGACHGGNTNLLPNRTLDICGQCSGDNSTCYGCDGVLASKPKVIDSCGNCGGNDCGCFKINSISPSRGPRSGGTVITIKGAGFFLNGSTYNSSAPNCGVPFTNPDGTAISVTCRLVAVTNGETLFGSAYIADHQTIICTTPNVGDSNQQAPQFTVSVRIAGGPGPFSSPVPYLYDDYAPIRIHMFQPTQALINSNTTVTFLGQNFINTSVLSCLVEGFVDCLSDSPSSGYLSSSATYHNSSAISCPLPQSPTPCQFRVFLSLDGQMSGIISSTGIDFNFIYAFRAPKVTSVHFAPELRDLVISFDQQADLIGNTTLLCAAIFSSTTLELLGNDNAQCNWSTTAQQEISVSLPVSASVQVNSPIRFRNGIIKTRGQRYSFAITDTEVPVSEERNAVKPVAILTGPNPIPMCGQVVFTAAESLHPGYKGFQYHWSLYTMNASIPNFFSLVNSLGSNAASVNLSTSDFLPNTQYYLQVRITNSLGLSDSATSALTKDSATTLQISIPGPTQYTLEHGRALLLESDTITNECVNLNGALDFQWQLQKVVDSRRMLLQQQQLGASIHTNSSTLLLPASSLAPNSSYVVTLTVQTANRQHTATKSVSLTILDSALTARIHGGNRTVSTSQSLVLDARTSTIITHSSPASFTWQCSVLGRGIPCYNTSHSTPTPITLQRASLINLPAGNLQAGETYNFTLLLKQGRFSSKASVLVEVIPKAIAVIVVEILTPTSEAVATEEITLEGLVWSQLPVTAHWECVRKLGHGFLDISSSGVNISQISYPARESTNLPAMTFLEEEGIVKGRVNRVNLVLSPGVLVPGLRYSFRLTGTYNGTTSHSEATITANPPPQTTSLMVQPSTGIALQTEFRLSVERATDSVADQPLLYQFGILQEETLYWLTGLLTTKYAVVLLPTGVASKDNQIQVVARIHDSKGGHSDSVSMVTVSPNTAATGSSFYQTILQTARNSLQSQKDWNRALAILTSSLLNLNTPSSGMTTAALRLLSDIYYNHMPVNHGHQTTIIATLELMTNRLTIEQASDKRLVTSMSSSIVSQLDLMADANLGSIQTGVSLVNGIPTPLTSDRYGLGMLDELVSQGEVRSLLQTWSNLVTDGWDTSTASAVTNGMRNLSNILCKQTVVGEQTIMATGGSLRMKTTKTTPIGAFRTAAGAIVDFGSAVESLYETQACPDASTACTEVCMQSLDYSEDYFSASNSRLISLQAEASRMILTQIEGSDPSSMELFSDIVSLDLSIPVQDRLLSVQNLASDAVKVYIPARSSSMPNGSTPLCIYRRPVSGSNRQWQLDSLQQPNMVTIEGRNYHLCSFSHLTEFAIGLLPPPIITLPPFTTPLPPSSTPMPTPSSSAILTSMTPSPTMIMIPSNTGVIAGVIIIILLLLAVAVVITLIVAFLLWRKKRSRKLKIAPTEMAEVAEQATVEGLLFEKKLLTLEEAKTPVRVIQLFDNGERTLLGTVKIIPSMRLRELRNHLTENFTELKEKPFYLCTKELCDIEPASEQQQFVSIVYNDVVFIRHVKLNSPLTRHQFCVCGKAAQFECSSCNAQGYCSQVCQQKHWIKEHQKLCSRISEKKRRSEVLLRRQMSPRMLPSIPEQPSSKQPEGAEVQPSEHPASPTDWKTFLSVSKSSRLPLLPKKTSVSFAPSQPLPQSPERKEEQQPKGDTPQPPSTSNQLSHKISLSSTRPSLPPLTAGGRASTVSIGKLASQGTTPQPPSRPLFPPASHISYGSRDYRRTSTLQPLATPGAQPLLARPGVISPPPTAGSTASYLAPTPLYSSYASQQLQQSLPYTHMLHQQQALQSYGQGQVLFRPPVGVHPPLMSPPAQPQMNRGWSVTSIGSTDLNMSIGMQRRNIRNEPLLEHEDESSDILQETKPATAGASSLGRPPSLSVRKRHSRMESRKSDESPSETSDSESSSDSGSDT